MKTENLKNLVIDMKAEKEKEKKSQLDKELEKIVQKDDVTKIQKEKEKPKIVVSDYHKANFHAEEEEEEEEEERLRLKELGAKKLKPSVNVEEISKEIYSSYTTSTSTKKSAEEKAKWFKKKPETSSRVVDSFESGIENFSGETLKEKIVSWRFDSSRDVYVIHRTRGKHQVFKNGEDILKLAVADLKTLARIKMLTTHPKGYDFEKYLRTYLKMDSMLLRKILM
ncbi:hypothetical protein L1987_42380 [Smallanthus sonchifolius]|uniref:Uncharacterized protein n=1 Tax=Smallanthus sonchifolius TaxID=185202 RepID=A0ACB9GIR4_9ASTR|nr:hypothetical protein L1987_42380 [Smallanthus sonchifolius]